MKKLKYTLIVVVQIHLILLVISACLPAAAAAAADATPSELPVKNTVTMIDLGAKTCIPCKMMAPILAELKEEYKGRAAVVFIDVREDKSQAKRFGVLSIPTQIFFDKHGAEVYRHSGFLSKEEIEEQLDSLLKTR